ncbi:MAG: PhnA domain-containing protein [Chitinophagales bacterium]
MSIENELKTRSGSQCELCQAANNLKVYEVLPTQNDDANDKILICETCFEQLENPDKANPNHWRCLNDSMWSAVPAVQVVSWRMLNNLRAEGWPQDLLDMMYLDEETTTWAKAKSEEFEETKVQHIDSNGNVLKAGDTVILTKTLNVKGSSITAKRGTAVRRISLVADNAEHIEGRVNGQHIVILTKFVKKSM